MSDGEIKSRLDGAAERFRDLERRVDQMAPLSVVTSEIGHLRDQIAEARVSAKEQVADARAYTKEQITKLDADCRERTDDVEETAMAAVKSVADASSSAVAELKKDKRTTWGYVLQVIGYGIALVAAVIAAKGIK